jgi:hypothetical protein
VRGRLAMIPGFLAAIACAALFVTLPMLFLPDRQTWFNTRFPVATVVQLLWVIPLDRWAAARSYGPFQAGLRFGARVILYIAIIPYAVMMVLAFWIYRR